MTISVPAAEFRGKKGGIGVALDVATGGSLSARPATAADGWADIYGWTHGGRMSRSSPPYTDPATLVATLAAPGDEVHYVDCVAADTYYPYLPTQENNPVVFYSLTTQSMTVVAGADRIPVGQIEAVHPYFLALPKQRDMTVQANDDPHAKLPDPTTVDLDLTVDLDDEDRPTPEAFGDRRIVICGTEGPWSDDETLTLQGGGSTLATLDQGSAVMYRLSTATKNDDDTWSMTWVAVTGEPMYLARVSVFPDYWRAQAAKLADGREHIVAHQIASTQGAKQEWTVTTDAPTGTQSDSIGWLSVGGMENGEAFRITAKESDETTTDSKIVTKTAAARNYSLCGGNCIVAVGPKGIRVNQIASGAQGYTVDTKVWSLRA